MARKANAAAGEILCDLEGGFASKGSKQLWRLRSKFCAYLEWGADRSNALFSEKNRAVTDLFRYPSGISGLRLPKNAQSPGVRTVADSLPGTGSSDVSRGKMLRYQLQ